MDAAALATAHVASSPPTSPSVLGAVLGAAAALSAACAAASAAAASSRLGPDEGGNQSSSELIRPEEGGNQSSSELATRTCFGSLEEHAGQRHQLLVVHSGTSSSSFSLSKSAERAASATTAASIKGGRRLMSRHRCLLPEPNMGLPLACKCSPRPEVDVTDCKGGGGRRGSYDRARALGAHAQRAKDQSVCTLGRGRGAGGRDEVPLGLMSSDCLPRGTS